MAHARTVEGLILPEWVDGLRDHQVTAIEECVEHFHTGKRMVVLDAPTGSGKTLIGEAVRQMVAWDGRSSYVCSSLTLQEQFAQDFPEAKVIMGRGNYPTELDPEKTAADCMGTGCDWCTTHESCPYQQAKAEAEQADIAVLNSTYQLYASNYTRSFRSRDLVVVDECDTLEGELMRFADIWIGEGHARQVKMSLPGAGVRYTTLVEWLREWSQRAGQRTIHVKDAASARTKRTWVGLVRNAAMVAADLNANSDLWVRQPHARALVMKPVTIDRFAQSKLWTHGDRFLLMSATVISAGAMLKELGWREPYGEVTVPMTFPKENRRIVARGQIDMAKKNKDVSWPLMVDAVNAVMAEHPDDNILVHTVSYELAAYLHDRCRSDTHALVTYTGREERADMLDRFRAAGETGDRACLFAPSMDRGVDLPDDLCRVQVVAKVPFPYLGDRQVSARMRLPGGQVWYSVETVRRLVQMTGRAVRSKDDWAVTYVLDGQFKKNVLTRSRRLLPGWWLEAVERQ